MAASLQRMKKVGVKPAFFIQEDSHQDYIPKA